MKSSLLTLLLSAALFAAIWRYLPTWSDGVSAHGRYYAVVLMAISGLAAVVALIRFIHCLGTQRTSRGYTSTATQGVHHPRQFYRLRFDVPPLPRFVQKAEAGEPMATFSCDVHDISETGLSLHCGGVYTKSQAVCGEVIFPSGRTTVVDGIVIRETGRLTCLQLNSPIDASLLTTEQREQIVADKDRGPQPPVIQVRPDTTVGNLPSHTTKGICRLKRS